MKTQNERKEELTKNMDDASKAVYNEILQKEMRRKLKEKIDRSDPDIIKTIKILLADDKKQSD